MNVLTVFDPRQVPTDTIADFLHWFDLTTEWTDDRDYTSTEGAVEPLVQWYEAMATAFKPHVDGAANTTRYIIGSTCIYARFADADAKEAFDRAHELAESLNLGVYESGSGEVDLPDGEVLS